METPARGFDTVLYLERRINERDQVMLELIMAIWGVSVLVTGSMRAGEGRVIHGGDARRCGLILLAPIPVSLFLIAPVISGLGEAGFIGGLIAEVVLVLICFGVARSLAASYAADAASTRQAVGE